MAQWKFKTMAYSLRSLGAISVFFAQFSAAQPAHAELKICNQSIALYNVAIGATKYDKFYTEGWWTLPANSCITPIKEDLSLLKLKYAYVYATTVSGDSAFEGTLPMCIASKRFKIEKVPHEPWNCWVRGFKEVKFREVDTGDSGSWTVFIRGTSQ